MIKRMMRIWQAVLLSSAPVISFGLFVIITLYTPWDVAPAIANGLKNQPGFDAVESGLYRNVYISSSGAFITVLYGAISQYVFCDHCIEK